MMWHIDQNNQLLELAGTKSASYVWVPSNALSFCRIQLPLNRRYAWQQMAPFALEEHLIGDIQDYHFALGEANKGGHVPAIVVAKELMETWLLSLSEHAIKPEKILPDIYAIPYQGQAVIWHEADHCYLRLDEQTGFSGSPPWIKDVMEVGLKDLSDFTVYSDAKDKLPPEWQSRAQALPKPLAECMMAWSPKSASINLLQGVYRTASAAKVWLYPWLATAATVLLALSLYLTNIVFETQHVNAQHLQMRQSTTQSFQKHFPNNSVADMRLTIGNLVQRLQSGTETSSSHPWLTLLRIDPILSDCKACRVEKINLSEGVATLEISSSEDLGSLWDRLQEVAGLEAERATLNDLLEEEQERTQMRFEFKVKEAQDS